MAITMMRVSLMSDARDVICSTCRNLDAFVVSKPVRKGKLLAVFHARWTNLLRFMQLYSKMDDGCIAAGVESKHAPALLACELQILEHALRRTNALLELRIAIRQTHANARCRSASATDVHAELAKRFRNFTAANDAHMVPYLFSPSVSFLPLARTFSFVRMPAIFFFAHGVVLKCIHSPYIAPHAQAMLPATKHLAEVGTENCVFMAQSAFDVLSEEERTFFVQYAIKALKKGAGGKLRARAFARRALQLLLCDLPDKVVRA